MANGIVDLQDLYEFDSFGGTNIAPGMTEEEEIYSFTSPTQDAAVETEETSEYIGGVPIEQTMVTSPELAKSLLALTDSYKTDYTATDFLKEGSKPDLASIGQIDDEELNEFLDKYAPQTPLEEFDKLFPKEDYKFEKRMALAKLGLNLMQPTQGGQIGAVIANAGKELTTDLASIQAAKRKDAKEKRAAIFNAQKEEEAARLQLASNIFLQNTQNELSLATKIYEQDVELAEAAATNMNEYNEQRQDIIKEVMKERYKTEVDDFVFEGPDGELIGPIAGVIQDNKIFVPHPTAVDANGYPVMVNYKALQYANPTTTDVTSDSKQKGDKITSANKFIDLKNEIDNYDRVVDMALNVQKSLTLNPEFAGFTGGFLSWIQDKLQIVKDFRTGFFSDDVKNRLQKGVEDGSFNAAFLPKSDMLLLPTDLITADGKGAVVNINGQNVQIFDDASAQALRDATNIAYEIMQNDIQKLQTARDNGEKEVNLGNGVTLGGQDADDLFGLLQYQKDLPLNEAASTAIIYALARARKASGRLNKDDIERAAATLNLYGESSKGVITKLDFVINELKDAAKSQIGTSIMLYGTGNEKDQKLIRKFILQRVRSGKALPLVYQNKNELLDLGFSEDQINEILEGFVSFRDYKLPDPGSAPDVNPSIKPAG
jgi:flagellar motor protein MotB